MLSDGTYEALVFDASETDVADEVTVELTIIAGEHKGEVISLRGRYGGDALDLLGVPATVTVTDDKPNVRFEPGL